MAYAPTHFPRGARGTDTGVCAYALATRYWHGVCSYAPTTKLPILTWDIVLQAGTGCTRRHRTAYLSSAQPGKLLRAVRY
eukprot:3287793-Rhodomonas_salina.8